MEYDLTAKLIIQKLSANVLSDIILMTLTLKIKYNYGLWEMGAYLTIIISL